MKMILLFLLFIVSLSQSSGSIQLAPVNSTLYASTSYTLSYFAISALPSSTNFTIDFTSSAMGITNGNLTLSATIGSTAGSGLTGACWNSKCWMRLNQATANNVKITFTFGMLRNPYFLASQQVSVMVWYNSSYNETNSYTINSIVYVPMNITLNSFTQSDYGVGNTNVTYIFNLSVPYTPAQPSLSVIIPSQVKYGAISTSLLFYGTNLSVIPMQFNQILVFDLSVTVNTAPSGFLLLTLSGMTNPQYMGLSSSFTIQFSLIQYMGVVCVGCLIAQLSSNLYAQSTTPGNIVTTMSSSSNNAVGQTTNVTFFLKLFAPIPVGGWLLILLPTCVTPFLPIYCNNVYGFSLVASSIPVCTYASNTINTTNFAYPYLVTEAVAIIELSLINAPDSRNMSFSFQTFDSSSRMIGNSSSQFITNASPLLLACNASRNNSQLQTPYTLTINLTLHVALAASSVLAVLLPASTYTLSQISCSSAGGALTCNKVIDINTKVLTVSLTPPCGSCAAGSVIVFFINNLINPAFINSVSQSVTVQTMSSYGVIESNTLQLQLLPMSLSLSNYARNGPANTGSFYTMNFNCSMPPYAVANGALLQLSFTSGDTYYNVLPSNGILSYQQSISVFDNNNNPLSNYVTYYNDLAPYSLQSIVITICNAGTCPSSINITGLRRGFTPLTTMMQNVTISTLAGDKMAENNFSALGYNPIMSVNSISMILSNSYTYSVSSYTINFLSSCIPIQSGLIIALSPYHSIAGGCFMATNSTQLGYGLTCTLLNSTTMSLSYTGDPTVMMIDYILYTLTITNVLNPPTVMPIQYQFTTYFNNIASQQFIKTYQIRNPFVLAVICTKDNNTYAQNALMTISIASGYPAFDQVNLLIPVGLMTLQSSPAYVQNVVNGNILVSGIYALNAGAFSVNIINPASTGINGTITVIMLSGGYQSAVGNVTIKNVVPVLLGLSAISSSSLVGAQTTLSLSIIRCNPYSAESSFVVSISSATFNLSQANYSSRSVAFPLSVPLTVAGTSMMINNLYNLKYIPKVTPISSGLTVTSLDSNGFAVASIDYTGPSLYASIAVDGLSYSFIRSNTNINGIGQVSITYTARYSSVISQMTINLPTNQSQLLSPTCWQLSSSNLNTSCTVLSSNASSITIVYNNQTQVVLTSVINLQPNANLLEVVMETSTYDLVERSAAAVQPAVLYNPLQVQATINSSVVATNCLLKIKATPTVAVDFGSQIKVVFPASTYTKTTLVPADCSYTVQNVTYTGCQFTISALGWLSQVILPYLGPSAIAVGSTVQIQLPVMNGWTNASFNSTQIVVYVVNSLNYSTAQGTIALSLLYNANSFLVATIIQSTISQSSQLANQLNTISLNVTVPVAIPVNTLLLFYLPKTTYTMVPTSGVTSDDTNWIVSLPVSCEASAVSVCKLAGSQVTASITTRNNLYVSVIRNSLQVSVQYLANAIVDTLPLTLPIYRPISISGAVLKRNESRAGQPVALTLSFDSPALPAVNVVITTQGWSMPILTSGTTPASATLTSPTVSSTPLGACTFRSNSITVSCPATNGSQLLTLFGINNLLAPLTAQTYNITISDNSYVYFSTSNIAADVALLPYNNGLTLQRINITVGSQTTLYLAGRLPASSTPLTLTFNGTTHYQLMSNPFNISLGSYTNTLSADDNIVANVVVANNDSYAYLNALQITPTLTPQNLSSFLSLTFPSKMLISESYNLTLLLSSTNMSYITIQTQPFMQQLTLCCIDPTCNQTLISSCTLISSSSSSNVSIQLTLSTVTPVTIVTLGFVTVPYQYLAANSSIAISIGLPSSSIYKIQNIMVYGSPLSSSLTVGNYVVNAINNFTLQIQPLSRVGYLSIQLPTRIAAQISSSSSTTMLSGTVNNRPLPISLIGSPANTIQITLGSGNSAITAVTILLQNVTNPPSNEPIQFVVQQSSDASQRMVYGYASLDTAMSQFDLVTLALAERNDTKIGMPIQLLMDITTPDYADALVIMLPSSQAFYADPAGKCTIMLRNTSMGCKLIGNNSLLTTNLPGRHNYTVLGLRNQLSINLKTVNDVVTVQIGYPYIRAINSPTSSVPITPRLTVGSLGVTGSFSTNRISLSTTTVTYNITLENWQTIDGIIIDYGPNYYLLGSSVQCSINGANTVRTLLSNTSVFISLSSQRVSQLTLQINNILNYLQPNSTTFRTVTISSLNNYNVYSNVDYYYDDGTTQLLFTPAQLALRIILPNNYVQSQPVDTIIMFDQVLNTLIPTASLLFNVSSKELGCSLMRKGFATQITLSCSLTRPLTAVFQLSLFDSSLPNISLATASKPIDIYAAPSSPCSNQQCDLCSKTDTGQYCFACREGLYSQSGSCQPQCTNGQFNYKQVCEPCSPQCSSCYGLSSSDCLSCANPLLLLDSGNCSTNCSTGSNINGLCLDNPECESSAGCRLCSSTGFCYQCLPGYDGEPKCQQTSVLPAVALTYALIPFLLAAAVVIAYTAISRVGVQSTVSMTIFSLSIIELVSWIVLIPILPSVAISMIVLSLLLLRIIISIASYELYYKKNLGQLSQKLLEEDSLKQSKANSQPSIEDKNHFDNFKVKLVQILAHINAVDSYELLVVKLGEPVLSVVHHVPTQVAIMVNRALVLVAAVYELSTMQAGDRMIIPCCVLVVGAIVSICRLTRIEKVQKCLTRVQ